MVNIKNSTERSLHCCRIFSVLWSSSRISLSAAVIKRKNIEWTFSFDSLNWKSLQFFYWSSPLVRLVSRWSTVISEFSSMNFKGIGLFTAWPSISSHCHFYFHFCSKMISNDDECSINSNGHSIFVCVLSPYLDHWFISFDDNRWNKSNSDRTTSNRTSSILAVFPIVSQRFFLSNKSASKDRSFVRNILLLYSREDLLFCLIQKERKYMKFFFSKVIEYVW